VAESSKIKPFTVSSLTVWIKSALESAYKCIYVEGEISSWRVYPSGHAYFTLKDSGAQISAVMFASSLARCKQAQALKDGAKVLVYANVSVYAPRGNYQLTVLAAKLVGEGDLMQRYLELKKKLEDEGLFDRAKKRPLPFMPRRVGIVTSEAGAVIHDMVRVLTRRFPAIEVRLYPSLVQGVEAPSTIIAGIKYFQNNFDPDILIVARGGGSFEDLFCFNDEELVRAVASSNVPTISAVGHETDYTLCDFAADVRAGTPSIAAEIAVPVLSEIKERVKNAEMALAVALKSKGEYYAQRLDHLGETLFSALRFYRQRVESRLERAESKLKLLSPYGVLERGYSLTTTLTGDVVRDASRLGEGERVVTRFMRGEVTSVVENVTALD
jgi:exodeoxyribonuclease VII large subunit